MSRKEETVYPSAVLAAIEYAKKASPEDKYGDSAFRLSELPRDGSNGTRWLTFSILKQSPQSKKWDYVPLRMRNMNVKTIANMKDEAAKKDLKQDFPGIVLTYDTTSVGSNDEPYGKAKLAISNAFQRLMTAALKSGKIYSENKTVKTNVQTFRWVNKTKGEKERLDKGIIRVKIPFGNDNSKITKDALPTVQVYDAEKPKPVDPVTGKVVGVPFLHATDEDGAPVNYTTIRQFIRCGSTTSFVEDMSGICISAQGASNPSKVDSFLIVKKGRGNKIAAEEAFDQSEFAAMAGAETGLATGDEVDAADGDEKKSAPAAKSTVAEPDDFDDIYENDKVDAEEVEEPKPAPTPAKKAPTTKKPAAKKPVKKESTDDLDEFDDE